MTIETPIGEAAQLRYREVLAAALNEAEDKGYASIRRDDVGMRANRAPACVNQAFGTMDNLKEAVMHEAIRTGRFKIVAQGLADGNSIARGAPQHIKDQALRAIS